MFDVKEKTLALMRLKVSRIGELGADAAMIALCSNCDTKLSLLMQRPDLLIYTLHSYDVAFGLGDMSISKYVGALTYRGLKSSCRHHAVLSRAARARVLEEKS